jgi:predicted O-linked N-acetylglucosamine transferase (SPINDLY family)
MEILQAVEGSVLWLPNYSEIVQAKIRTYCFDFHVDLNRLIFSIRINDHSDYLSSISHANLFLDTFPYNAHTTASDFLLSGVPLISISGSSFTSRVASSLLTTLNLSQLSVNNLEGYKNLAIKLALNTKYYEGVRSILNVNLTDSSLNQPFEFLNQYETLLKSLKKPPQ